MSAFWMFRRFLLIFALVVSGVSVPAFSVSASDIVVGSWNIQRLGHGDKKSYPALSAIASKVDLLAVQEVMTEEGLGLLLGQLKKDTGESWGYLVSHAIGSSSYKEMYAFVWREAAVEYLDGAVVYLDRGDRFMREPFSARFRSRRDGSELALGTVHIVYGKSIKDRAPEIRVLADYWQWMQEVYPGTPVALIGDFNLPETNDAWEPLKQYAMPLITQGATTLSAKPGRFANRYDNIWVDRKSALPVREVGIIDFPKMIGWSHKKSRKHVSDHAPVYMALGRAALAGGAVTVAVAPKAQPRSRSGSGRVDGSVRGNRNSKIYHRPDCPSYGRVSEKNRVVFGGAREAVSAGYRVAGNCP